MTTSRKFIACVFSLFSRLSETVFNLIPINKLTMKIQLFILSLFIFIISFNCLYGQINNEKETLAYKHTLRNQVPEKWYLTAPAMLRVTLKEGTHFKQLNLDSLVLNAQLDTIIKPVSYTHLRAHETRHDLV